jgi:dTDP-glucose 4,6-dehydratase
MIGLGTAADDVVAAAAVDDVATPPGHETVAAAAAEEAVRADVSHRHVVPGSGEEAVVAPASEQEILVAAAEEKIEVSSEALDSVAPRPAEEPVDRSRASDQLVVAASADDDLDVPEDVVALAGLAVVRGAVERHAHGAPPGLVEREVEPEELLLADPAAYEVGALSAVEEIDAGAAEEPVVAGPAEEVVAALAALERVVPSLSVHDRPDGHAQGEQVVAVPQANGEALDPVRVAVHLARRARRAAAAGGDRRARVEDPEGAGRADDRDAVRLPGGRCVGDRLFRGRHGGGVRPLRTRQRERGGCNEAHGPNRDPDITPARAHETRPGRRTYDGEGMPTSLVTGGAGFLGSHLCDFLLGEEHRVVCVDNLDTGSLQNIEHIRNGADFLFLNHDLTEPFHIDEPIDFVFHLASPASPIDYMRLPLHTLKVGSYGTHNMLGLAKFKRARFLLASTSEVYGDPQVHPQPETYWGHVNPIGPRGVYDEAKRYAEALTMAYHRQQGLNTCIARIFNTYGSRMRPHDGRAIPTFLRQAFEGKPVTVFGDGSQTRSFCYVDDLVRGLFLLASSGEHLPVNLGNPAEMSLLELAEAVIRVTGSPSEIVFEALPVDDPQVRQPDITRARQLLGWEPEVALDEGLRRTLDASEYETARLVTP